MRHSRVFIDTNVFLYTIDPDDLTRRTKAEETLRALGNNAFISVQVLQEFYNRATRKYGLAPYNARRIVEEMTRYHVVNPTSRLVMDAIDTHDRYSIQFWDALIIEAAVVSRCETVLTEDMQHGQVIRGVRIENPFMAMRP